MIPAREAVPAPDLHVSRWFNTPTPLTLQDLRGSVVAIEAFQMLCPGCVSHGMPQAQRIQALFPDRSVKVLGLHTVFEHHAAMQPVALEAFLHEYRIKFPVGVDAPGEDGATPKTMLEWGQSGTPTLWLLDRQGRIRAEHFGSTQDMVIGAQIAALLAEPTEDGRDPDGSVGQSETSGSVCRPNAETNEDAS